jgi:hypothetical protein
MYLNQPAPIYRSEHECDSPEINVWCTVMKNIISPFSFWRPYGDCWKFLAMMDTTSQSHRNNLPVRWFITSLLSPRSYLSEQEDEAQFPGLSHSPDLTPLDLIWGGGYFVKYTYITNQENVQNVN